jgi:hypothetical protein
LKSISKSGEIIFYNASFETINQYLGIVIQEISSIVLRCFEIEEEKKKTLSWLQSIIPAKIAKRISDGESSFSFSVQSASIIYLNIAGFNNWISILPANAIQILNQFFQHPNICQSFLCFKFSPSPFQAAEQKL